MDTMKYIVNGPAGKRKGGDDCRRRLDPGAAGKQRVHAGGRIRFQREHDRAEFTIACCIPGSGRDGNDRGRGGQAPARSRRAFWDPDGIRQVGNAGSEVDGGTCVHVAIDNTLYNNITLHPDWAGGLLPSGQLGVCMVDVAELIIHPCGHITNKLTVLLTVAHPNLDPNGVSIVMTGPGGPYNFTLPPIPEVGDWFGTSTHSF